MGDRPPPPSLPGPSALLQYGGFQKAGVQKPGWGYPEGFKHITENKVSREAGFSWNYNVRRRGGGACRRVGACLPCGSTLLCAARPAAAVGATDYRAWAGTVSSCGLSTASNAPHCNGPTVRPFPPAPRPAPARCPPSTRCSRWPPTSGAPRAPTPSASPTPPPSCCLVSGQVARLLGRARCQGCATHGMAAG